MNDTEATERVEARLKARLAAYPDHGAADAAVTHWMTGAEIAEAIERITTLQARAEAAEARERAALRGLAAIAKPEYGIGFRGLKGIARRTIEFVQSKSTLTTKEG